MTKILEYKKLNPLPEDPNWIERIIIAVLSASLMAAVLYGITQVIMNL
jgi:hypothetical protein